MSKVFLLVGESGAGKSTFINTIGNYFANGTLNNLKVLVPTPSIPQNFMHQVNHSEILKDKSMMTNECRLYTFLETETSQSFGFIDTPGFGSLIMSEDSHHKALLDAVKENEGDLCGLIYIMNSYLDRGNKAIPMMIKFLKISLPEHILKNSLVIFTKGYETTNDPIQLGIDMITPNAFHMQNSAFGTNKPNPNNWSDSMEIIEEFLPILRKIKSPNKIVREMSLQKVNQKYNTLDTNGLRSQVQKALIEVFDSKNLIIADNYLSMSIVKSIIETRYFAANITTLFIFSYNKLIFDIDKFILPADNIIVLSPHFINQLDGSKFGHEMTPIYYHKALKNDTIFHNLVNPTNSSDKPFVIITELEKDKVNLVTMLDLYISYAHEHIEFIGDRIAVEKFINLFYSNGVNYLKKDLIKSYTMEGMLKRFKDIDKFNLSDPKIMIESYNVFYDFIEDFKEYHRNPINDPTISLLFSATQSKINQLLSFTKPPPPINNIKLFMDEVVATGVKEILEAEHQRMIALCKIHYEGSIKEKIAECRDYIDRINKLIISTSDSFNGVVQTVTKEIEDTKEEHNNSIDKLEDAKSKCKFNMVKGGILIGLNLLLFTGFEVLPYGKDGAKLIDKSMDLIQDPTNMKYFTGISETFMKLSKEGEKKKDGDKKDGDKKDGDKKDGDKKDGDKKDGDKKDGNKKDGDKKDGNKKDGDKKDGKDKCAKDKNQEDSTFKQVQKKFQDLVPIIEQSSIIAKNWSEMKKISKNIEKFKKGIQELNEAIRVGIPRFTQDLMNILQDLGEKQKSLSNVSSASRKFQVIDLTNQYKKIIEHIGKVLSFLPKKQGYEGFIRIFEELKLYLSVSMDINDKVEEYEDRIQMIGYMANISSSKSQLCETNNIHIDLIAQTKMNLAMERYHQGTKGFLQCLFPFGLEVASSLQCSNTYSSQVEHLAQAMKEDIRSIQRYVNIGLSQINKNITDNILKCSFDIKKPFYRWNSSNLEGFSQRVKELFKEEAVTFYADIEKEPQSQATKFQTIRLAITSRDPNINDLIQRSMSNIFFELTHSGRSYYRFNHTIFLMLNDYCTIKYKLSTSDQVSISNSTMDILAKSEPTLSPYTYWTFKLNDIYECIGKFLKESDYSNIELSLIGLGQCVHCEKYVYDKAYFDRLYSNYIVE